VRRLLGLLLPVHREDNVALAGRFRAAGKASREQRGNSPMNDIVQKLWGFCHTLRHDGIDYGDYIEQITYLLFLKMANERQVKLPKGCGWGDLKGKTGDSLTDAYAEILTKLGEAPGLLGEIYSGAQSKFNNAANLKKLVTLIDETRWTSLGVDVKAHAYEGLLEKAASEGKKGAGQYFTPRVLIESIVRCMKPDPRGAADFKICDPACGTGGFLVAAYEWLVDEAEGKLDRETATRVRKKVYYGQELVARPRRLALMNLLLHELEPTITLTDTIYEPPPSERYDVVLTNPPFGNRGANSAPNRADFPVKTSNKQLNFVQHILTVIKPSGRAAVVLPDNSLFEDHAAEVFKHLTKVARFHTLLRLPRGTFTPYSQGVKANVVFFTNGGPTTETWVFDARTNVPIVTKKDRPLNGDHFAEFEKCYGADPDGLAKRKKGDSKDDRWRKFPLSALEAEGFKPDKLRWLQEELGEPDEPGEPEELATEAMEELQAAWSGLEALLKRLEEGATS
jgi:type I restriction enzyme M protein